MRRPSASPPWSPCSALAFFAAWSGCRTTRWDPGLPRGGTADRRARAHQRYESAGQAHHDHGELHAGDGAAGARGLDRPDRAGACTGTVLYPPGEDRPRPEHQRAISQMDQSKIDATYVVLQRAHRLPQGARRGRADQARSTGCPAEGELFAGDLVIGRSTAAGRVRASRRAPGDRRGAGRRTRRVPRTGGGGDPRHRAHRGNRAARTTRAAASASSWSTRSRSGVEISSGDVGGPSAGLMFALGLYDVLTPGDLTAGARSPAPGRSHPTATSARSAGSPTRSWPPSARGHRVPGARGQHGRAGRRRHRRHAADLRRHVRRRARRARGLGGDASEPS